VRWPCADPIDAVSNSFFDHQLDALQKALVADPKDSWLYSGGYLPWQAFKDHRSLVQNSPLYRKNHWYMDEPGLLLFRSENVSERKGDGRAVSKENTSKSGIGAGEGKHAGTKKAVADKSASGTDKSERGTLLLVYLVGEVPTLGIQRDALTHAIHAIHDIVVLSELKGYHRGISPFSQPVDIRIIGPTFTGGAHSLKEGLRHAEPTIRAAMSQSAKPKTRSTNLTINISADGSGFTSTLSVKKNWQKAAGQTKSDDPAQTNLDATVDTKAQGIAEKPKSDSTGPEANQSLFSALIINGSATAIADDYFEGSGKSPQIQYLARTVCSDKETFRALHEVAGPSPIIWLTETGTAFSSGVRSKYKRFPVKGQEKKDVKQEDETDKWSFGERDIIIPVPIGISRVRGEFERQLTAAKQQMVGLPLIASTSPLPFDPEETSHDTPAIQTPQILAPAAELLLNQIMHAIANESTPYVGIMATDVRDSIFLAEMLKLHCPNVQLLIAESDILLIHSTYTDSLCGSIVASSYPLFPEGLKACQRGDRSLPVMGGAAQYGIYNAILLQRLLARPGVTLPPPKAGVASLQFENSGDASLQPDYSAGLLRINGTIGPSVWLHRVGYSRFYPRNIVEPAAEESEHYPVHRLNLANEIEQPTFQFRVSSGWYAFPAIVLLTWVAIFVT
jgi:hypothetical protein